MASIVRPITRALPSTRGGQLAELFHHRVEAILETVDLVLELHDLRRHADHLAARGQAEAREPRVDLLLGRLLRPAPTC